ncbi:luciferin sulfotransferase-like, partial [Phlebotomus argentipes]|uniref:luciferin sulfotransferase-like n=1 Tax=Phlebotomus argentipes TaxID=94469 RepID=UPI0028930BF9
MPIVFENVEKNVLSEKAKFLDVEHFIRVRNTEFPDLEIASKWHDRAYFFPDRYEKIAEKIQHFTVREDDVWVISFAKCGSTWSEEMVWQICNDLDFDAEKAGLLSKRFPYFENQTVATEKVFKDSLSDLSEMTGRRY